MSGENTKEKITGIEAYNNVPKDASGAIPLYAKALKLLKKNQDEMSLPNKIGTIEFQLKRKSEVDTGENLNHTNFQTNSNEVLSKVDAYKIKNVDSFPFTMSVDKNFPIVPFGDSKYNDTETTFSAFNKLFNKDEDLRLGTKNGALTYSLIIPTASEKDYTITYAISDDEKSNTGGNITISGDNVIAFLNNCAGWTSFNDLISTMKVAELKRQLGKNDNYEFGTFIKANYVDQGENIVNVKDDTLIYKVTSTSDATGTSTPTNDYYVGNFNNKNNNKVGEKSLIVLKPFYVENIEYRSSVDDEGAFHYDAANSDITKSYKVSKWDTSSIPPTETAPERDGSYLTSVETNYVENVTIEEIEKYCAQSFTIGANKGILTSYYNLINHVLADLDYFYENSGKYLFNMKGKLSKNDSSMSIEDTKEDENTHKIKISLSEISPTLKTINVITERKDYNDVQFVEMPIYQMIEDDYLKAEIFQIFKISAKCNERPSISWANDANYLFSENFKGANNVVGLAEAIQAANKDNNFNEDTLYEELSKARDKDNSGLSTCTLKYTKVSHVDVMRTEHYGLFGWFTRSVYDHTDWYYGEDTTRTEVRRINPSVIDVTLTWTPIPPSPFSFTRQVFDDNSKKLINNETVNLNYTSSTTSLDYYYQLKFTSKDSSTIVSIPKETLFYFVNHYKAKLAETFTGYEKAIKSLSLFDIITEDIYNEEDLEKKYYFSALKIDEDSDNLLLKSAMNSIKLIPSSAKENGEPTNKFYLTRGESSLYTPKYILCNDDVLSKLISIN